ncbi:hypothetical protein ABRV10_002005 [Citrobacter amalonaticus]
MTTITRERVAEIIHAAGLEPCDYEEVFGSIKTGEIVAMARIALASLEAEPALYAAEETLAYANMGELHLTCLSEPMGDAVIPLYTAPPAPVSVPDYPETLPCPVMLEPGLRFGKGVKTHTMLGALKRRAEYYAEMEAMTPEQRAEHGAGMREFTAMLQAAPVRSSMPDGVVTAEHRRVIEMLLKVCGAAFELADDSCQQDVDGEECHVVPDDAFQKLSDALDEIENTLPTEDVDRPDVFLAWSAMPRAALKSLLQTGNSPVIPDSSEDTKRLNWLDAQNKRLNEYYGTSYGWKFDANFQRNAMMLNDSNYPVMTVRQAIDQAIASAPQQEVNRE